MQTSTLLHGLGLFIIYLLRTPSPASPQAAHHWEQPPVARSLTYRIEWHSVIAGTTTIEYKHSGTSSSIDLSIESAGLVNRLYHVLDKYTVKGDEQSCPTSSYLDAQEGKKHTTTRLTFDKAQHSVEYHEHDLLKNTDTNKTVQVPPCTHEVAGALALLAELDLPPGRSTSVPVTDGKKVVNARVESQAKETITVNGKSYNTIRYEVFLFDNVLYKRKGRLFIWVTDDAEHIPVQFRIALAFPIGNIMLELEKEQKL